jgi:hypothetical protein
MALSDCINCWNTPCTCGWYLRTLTEKHLIEQKILLERAIEFKQKYPNAIFSDDWKSKMTKDDMAFMHALKGGTK